MCEIVEATSPEQVEQARNLFAEYRAQLPVEYCARAFDAEIAALPGVYGPPQGELLLATGEWDMCWNDNERMADIMRARGIRHELYVWGDRSYHDWPWWRPMARAYLG